MRKLALFVICALTALPAFADDTRKMPPQQDLLKQETVALGNNRFLIFSGTASGHGQYGYTVDLVKIDDGVPHFDPLFMEEYNPETNKASLEYGVAFMAASYHFDKAANALTLTTFDEDSKSRLHLTYKLDVDIFKLEQVDSQETCKEPCTPEPPKTIFKASSHAKAQ